MANQSDSEFEYDPEAFESAHAEAAKSPQLPKEEDDGSDFEMPSELVRSNLKHLQTTQWKQL